MASFPLTASTRSVAETLHLVHPEHFGSEKQNRVCENTPGEVQLGRAMG